MNGLTDFITRIFTGISRINFSALLLCDLCAFGGIFAVALILCICSRKFRRTDKRPFLHLTNAFTAETLALFATRYTMPQSVTAAALFWCAGYLMYGLLCAITPRGGVIKQCVGRPLPVFLPQEEVKPPVPPEREIPQANSVVRLDHAIAVADKLLLKPLGRGDRQETEKIKTALTIIKIKGESGPQDGAALNEMFNALLKLMAKYDA